MIGMKKSFKARLVRDLRMNKYKYILVLPVVIFFILFHYKAMYGVIIAFKNYRPTRSISESEWVGLKHIISFFKDPFFGRLLKNTVTISFLSIVTSFPVPIFLALLLNEVRVSWFKRTIQTITYMPHFIALVVVCGLITSYCQTNGVINDLIVAFGGERTNLLMDSKYFYPIYMLSDIWQSAGWGSIIYLAALAGIDQEQYEAARIDGAGRIRQMIYITFPGLLPVVSMMLIMRLGSVLSVGSAKILLLYQPVTFNVADVISTYVYRRGVLEGSYSYGTAVELFNSGVNIIFLLVSNKVSKKLGQSGLF